MIARCPWIALSLWSALQSWAQEPPLRLRRIAAGETIVLTQRQPFANYNAFGPDGYLYLGFGDGGGARDPQNNAQNPRTWLGKMLRIDTESDPARYRLPEDNPFVARQSGLSASAIGPSNSPAHSA